MWLSDNFCLRFLGCPHFSSACSNGHALCNQLVTPYLCLYPARAHTNVCSSSSSHCALLGLSGCRANASSPLPSSPFFSPFQHWERIFVSMGDGETKIAVRINPLHSQLQNGSKCRTFSSKKGSPHTLMVATYLPALERLGGWVLK